MNSLLTGSCLLYFAECFHSLSKSSIRSRSSNSSKSSIRLNILWIFRFEEKCGFAQERFERIEPLEQFERNKVWSGRPGSNRRRPAWEAGILPLNYARSEARQKLFIWNYRPLVNVKCLSSEEDPQWHAKLRLAGG
jgi:hypothetical protein